MANCAANLQANDAGQVFLLFALLVVENNAKCRLRPDSFGNRIILTSFLKLERWQETLNYFDIMRKSGYEVNNRHYSVALKACEIGGKWQQALELFQEMKTEGIHRDSTTYTSVISALEPHGKWKLALDILEGIPH